jgi:hypothetical protein
MEIVFVNYIFREVFYESLNDEIDDQICKAGKTNKNIYTNK